MRSLQLFATKKRSSVPESLVRIVNLSDSRSSEPKAIDALIASKYHLITAGHARLIVRGNINFMDGFHRAKNTPFAHIEACHN